VFQKTLDENEVQALVAELEQRGVISVQETKVGYKVL
jgi:hypothetical protein